MNSPASVRARLLNVSGQSGEDFQAVLTRYAIERLLYRLGESSQRDSFILKGAMLFVAWEGNLHRPTKDLDLLGMGQPALDDAAKRIREIAAMPADDGMIFDSDSVKSEVIREDAVYEGIRVKLDARLDQARVRMQVDIGFGDAVEPAPSTGQFPTILGEISPPRLRMYPAEAVVAENVHAMVVLDISNSRMKDFYDVWHLSRTMSFELATLKRAFWATFERRRTELPQKIPFALTHEFLRNEVKMEQWSAFVRRLHLHGTPDFLEVGASLTRFVEPVFLAAMHDAVWTAGGPWRSESPVPPDGQD